jgi:tripartite ATP-independent transporter DctM subunit
MIGVEDDKKISKAHEKFRSAEDWTCNVLLIIIALVPALEYFLSLLWHLIFNKGISALSEDISMHLLLVVGLVSGMITTRKQEHLSIGVINYIKNEKILCILKIAANLLSSFISIILFFASLAYIKVALAPAWLVGSEFAAQEKIIAFIPEWVFVIFIPLGFAVMAVRFLFFAPLKGKARIFYVLTVILGIVFSIPVIFKFLWGFDFTDPDFTAKFGFVQLHPAAIADAFTELADFIKVPTIVFLIVLAFGGTPLFIIFAAISIVLFESAGWEIDTIITDINFALIKSDFVAIPLFTLVGFFLSESKAGERLVKMFKSFFGWFPGGMVIVTVMLCAFFTTFTGASGVTILALGGILYAILCERGSYSSRFSTGLVTSSGSIGLLFPPSLPIILVGVTMQQSILKLFAAGVIPGLILTAAMIVFGIFTSIKSKIPVEKFDILVAFRSLKESFFEMLLPFLLLFGFLKLGLSLIQISAIALVYIFIVEVFIKRDIKLKNVGNVFAKAIPIIGGILCILALSKGLSDYVIFDQIPQNFAHFLRTAINSKILFLLLLNLALLVVGCFMDIFSAIAVVLPLIVPLAEAYSIDPLHLGIIFLINLEAGFLTPPVGLNLFLASYRFNKPFVEICRCVLPFLAIQIIVVLLITYIPLFSTFLPNILNTE